MNKRTVLKIYILVFSFVCASCGQTNTSNKNASDKTDKINEIVSLYSDYDGFNGTVLVSHEGKIIYKKGFGLANMEWDIPNQVDTKFRLASITKPFTSILIMQLVAENTLDLHEPISKYLPDYPKANGDQITLHHILSHTSGIVRDYESDKKLNQFPDRAQLKQKIAEFSELPLEFKPGEKFTYSNSGYMILGYIIETVTGNSYEDVLKENILEPLGMKNTGVEKHRPIIKQRAKGYFKGFGDYFNSNYVDMSNITAVGNLYSTVEDLFLFDQALKDESLLPKKYMDLVFTKHIPDVGYGGFHGYGWELKEKPIGNSNIMVETIGHSGSIDGFCSLFTRIPSSNSSIIFLNNTKRAYLNAMTTAITGILNDETYDFPKKPLAKFMTEVIKKEGMETGISFYREHKDDSAYSVREQELIVAGYRYLHADNAKDAAEIFKLSTEIFPDRDNPYDSYAEALMALGKNDEAIKNYKKSLELNPKNDNAVKMLEKLGVDGTTSNDILEMDSSWGKEIFSMPLHFAQDIKLKGIEDARFSKGWIDENSPDFWSYAFAWNVDFNEELSRHKLEDFMRKYYDGLLSGVNKEKDLVLPKTIAAFSKNDDGTFSGNVTIYDTFVTKAPLVLNIRVNQEHCKQKNKSVILYRISPADLDKDIWNTLDKIKIIESICD